MGHLRPDNQSSGDPRLAGLADLQHAVVSREQFLGLGLTRQRLQTYRVNGILHRRFPGVYSVGHRRLTQKGLWMAAVLACGDGALLSHRDAGRLHMILRGTGSGPIHVTAPRRHRLPGICCHRMRTVDPRDATVIDAIPVTTWARTALDLSTELPRARVRDALELAERQERDFSELRELIDRSSGHHGLPTLKAALAELGDHVPELRSHAEADLLAGIREAGLPEPQTNVIVDGELVDFHWPEQRLVVDVDGRQWHGLQRDMESDRRRDVKLTLAGQRPVRYTAQRIATELPAVIAEIEALLAADV